MNTENKRVARGIEDLLIKIGQIAENQMEEAETAEEYAFLFGHVNFAAAVVDALHNDKHTVKITMDYDKAMKAYTQANENAQNNQLSMEELFASLFEKVIEEAAAKKAATKKPTTKKSTKKE